MENGRIIIQIEKSDLEELKREIRHNKTKLTGVTLLLLLIAIALGYLSFNTYRENNASKLIDSTRRVLMVSLTNNYDEISDEKQVGNALLNGGMIQLQIDGEALLESFGNTNYKQYGASGSSGKFYIMGAMLNYIASRGWTLIQSSTSILNNEYYFIK
ncbi:MAG: hypothetical protein M0R38_11140 [Bacteroidia bacterium]|jgi:hypothetical protein|nr:hypothetical protein [Bacteroidia bacterium]